MYCSHCGQEAAGESKFCAGCGAALEPAIGQSAPAARRADRRPVAGIVVAIVLGSIGLVWSCVELFSSLSGTAGGVKGAFFAVFPGLRDVQFLATSAGMIGNTAVLIGALMSFLFHPGGPRVVRAASWTMLVIVAIGMALTGVVISNSEAWRSLDAPTRGSFIGGIIGAAIGGVLQWVLILFLFRKTRWP